jgi:hypothetical protein
MAQAEFSYSGEAHLLPGGRALVRGTRVAALKSARDHVDKAIAMIEQKWRP